MIYLSAFADEAAESLSGQINALVKNNINYTEIRSVNGVNVSKFDIKTAKEYQKQMADNGIKVWSIGSPIGKVDINVNFKSRHQAVKKADAICRMVKTEFPSVSSSSLIPRCYKTLRDAVKRFGKATPEIENGNLIDQRYYNMYDLFLRTDRKIQNLVRIPYHDATDTISAYKILAESVKKHNCANCAELTRLANLICAVNGIDAQPINLILCDKEEKILSYIDHTALAIPLKEGVLKYKRMGKTKDVIIIDPWLGIADFAKNIALEYQNKFRKHLNIEENGKIVVDPYVSILPIPKTEYKNLKKEFPNLVLKA